MQKYKLALVRDPMKSTVSFKVIAVFNDALGETPICFAREIHIIVEAQFGTKKDQKKRSHKMNKALFDNFDDELEYQLFLDLAEERSGELLISVAFKEVADLEKENLRGIINLGNTCYANSLVQIINVISPFRDLIFRQSTPEGLFDPVF